MMTQANKASHDHNSIDLLVRHLEDPSSGAVIFIVSHAHPSVIVCKDRVATLAVI